MAKFDGVRRMRRGLLCAVFLVLSFQSIQSRPAEVIYEYDRAGRLKSATYDNGTVVTYVLDAAGNRKLFSAATPAGALGFSVLAFDVSEGGGSATITVARTGGNGGAVAVSYATANGTASAGNDYTSTSGTLNWPSGDIANKTFSIPILQDGVYEGPETVSLSLGTPTGGATLGAAAATLTINDDESPPVGTLQLGSSSYAVGEGGGSLTITVNRTGGSYGTAGINYATANGTATAGSDYTATSGSLSWSHGDAAGKTFSIPILQDGMVEGIETLSVTLSGVSGAGAGSPASATITITDDDVPPPGSLQFSASSYSVAENGGSLAIIVTRTGGSAGAASINYTTANGTASAGSDFTAATGTLTWSDGDATDKSFSVAVATDTSQEGSETFTVSLSGVTGAAAGSPGNAMVTLTDVDVTAPGAPGAPVISDITATTASATWSAASDNWGVVEYRYSLNGGASWTSAAAFTAASITGLASGTAYTLLVQARDAAGNWGPSSTASFNTIDTTAPGQPGTPTFSAITGTTATATWTAASDNVGVTQYRYSINGGASWTNVGNVLTASITGLVSGISNSVIVQAGDAAGNWGEWSGASVTTPDVVGPGAPGTPTFTNVTVSSATLNWTAATDNVAVTGYRVRVTGEGPGGSQGWIETASLTFDRNGLYEGRAYTVQVEARDAAGNWGTTASATLNTANPPPSVVIYDLLMSRYDTSTMFVEWQYGGGWTSDLDGYEYQINGTGPWTPVGISYVLLPMPIPSDFTFSVRARDLSGQGGPIYTETYSDLPEVITVVSGLTLTPVAEGRYTMQVLSWGEWPNELLQYNLIKNGQVKWTWMHYSQFTYCGEVDIGGDWPTYFYPDVGGVWDQCSLNTSRAEFLSN